MKRGTSISDTAAGAPLFPVALKLEGRTCLVAGGGPVAARKAAGLLAAGARVRAVAPSWCGDFETLAASAGAALVRHTRRFLPDDLDGAAIVLAATGDPATEGAVARAARARGVLCNVADVNDLCDFYLPATLRRGSLAVSVSTDGRFPLLAVALRDRIARLIGPAFAEGLEALAEARRTVRARVPGDAARRAALLRDLLDDESLGLLLEGRLDRFLARVESWRDACEA